MAVQVSTWYSVLTVVSLLWLPHVVRGDDLSGSNSDPSVLPSQLPSQLPTELASRNPTIYIEPSPVPSDAPTQTASNTPSYSHGPSLRPSKHPTLLPTTSAQPSQLPTFFPSWSPSTSPQPSRKPSNTPTFPPSVNPSSLPSSMPSLEPNCTSFTDGPVAFRLYLSLRVDTTVPWIPSWVQQAYNEVVGCDVKGSFRTIEAVTILGVNSAGSTEAYEEVMLELSGSCEGCDPDLLVLFNDTLPVGGHELEMRRRQNFHRRANVAKLCDCPAPPQAAFLHALTSKISNETGILQSVTDSVELEEYSVGCWNDSDHPIAMENFTSHISFLVEVSHSTTSPSADELDVFAELVWDVFRSEASFSNGVCDPWKREIIEIIDVQFAGRGVNRRKLLRSKREISFRKLEEAGPLEWSQVVVVVNASCVGCQGQLFGDFELDWDNSTSSWNDTDDIDTFLDDATACLCPVHSIASGVDVDMILESLHQEVDGSSSFVKSVYDVDIVEPIDCPSQRGTFSSLIVVEYQLSPSATQVTAAELLALQEGLVAAYNWVSRLFCDPYHRRLTKAQVTQTSGVVFGEPYALEFNVTGTCRGCDNNITLYDSVSFLTNISLGPDPPNRLLGGNDELLGNPWQGGRLLADESLLTTCYCALTAVPDQGPSEVEVVAAYGDITRSMNLTNVAGVADCQFITTFQSSVILSFKGEPKNVTEEELLALGQGFVDTYNRINSGDEVCDRQFRRLTDFRVDANITLNQEFLDAGGLSGRNSSDDDDGRRTLTRTTINRRLDDPFSSTNAPSSAPTTIFGSPMDDVNLTDTPSGAPSSVFGDTTVNALLYVSGTCRGCSNNFGLFDQISGRRRLEESGEIHIDFLTVTGSCFCPPDAVLATPSEDVIVEAFEETVEELKEAGTVTFVEEVEELEEVTVVQCVVETNEFESVVVVEFFAYFEDIDGNDLDAIRVTFNTTYNELSEEYCDTLFRRTLDTESIEYQQISEPNGDGESRVRFYLTMRGRCRDCHDGDRFLETGGGDADRRNLKKEEDLCFCDAGTIANRPPTEDEFEVVYREAWRDSRRQRGRKLFSNNVFELVRVGLPGLTSTPSAYPTTDPTAMPSLSQAPSAGPSAVFSESPSASPLPSSSPSFTPSLGPTVTPTTVPSVSLEPSVEPSPGPTVDPSPAPTSFPTAFPTAVPTDIPSSFPSSFPSNYPSSFPSTLPSLNPSTSPTTFPSAYPTNIPTTIPSSHPTGVPSIEPTPACYFGTSTAVSNDCGGACCKGEKACDYWDGQEHEVCVGSCIGDYACFNWTSPTGSISIAKDSCLGDYSCHGWGSGDKVVQEGSCSGGIFACAFWGSGEVNVETGSCSASGACMHLPGNAIIGQSSCTHLQSCFVLGNSSLTSSVVVGTGACQQSHACQFVGRQSLGSIQIKDGACDGTEACYFLGGSSEGAIDVQSGACVGTQSCRMTGFGSNFTELRISAGVCVGDPISIDAVPQGVCEDCRRDCLCTLLEVDSTSFCDVGCYEDVPDTCTDLVPSGVPSQAPSTSEPSSDPSQAPSTSEPSSYPSAIPSLAPSTSVPSSNPSAMPSQAPSTSAPSSNPSVMPSQAPSTSAPSSNPSAIPSQAPSTPKPSSNPSAIPSQAPSTPKPSSNPSEIPSQAPSTSEPSSDPTTMPSQAPSTSEPSSDPSTMPSQVPSTSEPSSNPSGVPSPAPSTPKPSSYPSPVPTRVKSSAPTRTPVPTNLPSSEPSSNPTTMPSPAPSPRGPTSMPTPLPLPLTGQPTIGPTPMMPPI